MKITFIGSGSMATAIIHGCLAKNAVQKEQIWVTNKFEKDVLNNISKTYGVHTSYDYGDLLKDATFVVLAMKPKDVAEAVAQINSYLTSTTCIISVVAGIQTAAIESALNGHYSIVRTMPNTSATIGLSATGIYCNDKVTDEQRTIARSLFEAIGTVVEVDEPQLDLVTALSGSGPAYVYYVAEAMQKGAIELGMDAEIAKSLTIQTLLGAATMLAKSNKDAATLRHDVTSPGGTTEAGLGKLAEHNVAAAFAACIETATKHSEVLRQRMKVAELNK